MAPSSPASKKWLSLLAVCALTQAAAAQAGDVAPDPKTDPRAPRPKILLRPDAHVVDPSDKDPRDPDPELPPQPPQAPTRGIGVVDPAPREDPRGVRDRDTATPRDWHRFSFPEASTDWTSTARLPLFDPALGILRRTEIYFSSRIVGDVGVESLAEGPNAVSLTFAGRLTLTGPDGTVLAESTLDKDVSVELQAYDGITDFGGTSGATFADIVVQEDAPLVLAIEGVGTAGGESIFERRPGHDSVELLVSAIGTSGAGRGGNMVAQFSQAATATLSVSYVYDLDCNKNGVADHQDVNEGASYDIDSNGVPDECTMSITPYCFGDGSANGGPKCPCSNDGAGDTGCLNSSGVGARLEGEGVASVTSDTLRLVGSGIPGGVVALYMQGKGMANHGLGEAFGDGLRCISAPFDHMTVQTTPMTDGSTVHPASGDLPISVKEDVRVGETWHYQIWYRNPGGPCGTGSNTTNALRVVWTE